MAAINSDYALAKDTGICKHCDKVLPKNIESARRLVWDHYVVYVCTCGHFTQKCESLYSHQRKKHEGYTKHARIDKCFFQQARMEINANFLLEFPTKIQVPYTIPTHKARTFSPKKSAVKPPTPKRTTTPAATITAPPSTHSPVKQSTPTPSPVKDKPPSNSNIADTVDGPDIEAILCQMTSNKVPKLVSPIKEPRVTLSNITKGQKRAVTFTSTTPPAEKKKRRSKVPTIVKDLRYELDQLKRDYRCIDNIQQLLRDTKTTADNRLSRIEEMLSHLERESVENV
jgi:hypothetical protein